MSKAVLHVRRPVARIVDGMRYTRDRRRHVRQFHRITRVTLQSQ